MTDAAKIKVAMREIQFRYSTALAANATPLLEPIENKDQGLSKQLSQ
jgi:hypothetical protein